jgi:hypothetical protein
MLDLHAHLTNAIARHPEALAGFAEQQPFRISQSERLPIAVRHAARDSDF